MPLTNCPSSAGSSRGKSSRLEDGALTKGAQVLKPSELRQLDEEELEQKLKELKTSLFNLRFQLATRQLENPMKIKETKRDIARVFTVMTEREFGIYPEAFEGAGLEEETEETIELEETLGEKEAGEETFQQGMEEE